jgi:hypothetical protein
MRMRGGWGLALVLLLGWGAAAASAADENGNPGRRPSVPPNERPGLIDKIFNFLQPTPVDKKREPKPNTNTTDDAKPAEKPKSPGPNDELARQQSALLRRQAACDKLSEIAVQTNNRELEQLAQELNSRAWAVYTQRTAALKGEPRKTPTLDIDEQILDKKLGMTKADQETVAPGKATAGGTKGQRTQAASGEGER